MLKPIIAAAALATAAPAAAQTYLFTLTGDYAASWRLDAAPVPALSIPGVGFIANDVRGTFGGIAGGVADIDFYAADLGGGLEIDDPTRGDVALLLTNGPTLYAGTEDAPRFLTGSFALTEFGGTGRYALTVADAAAAPVPEPSGWAVTILGVGIIGGALRAGRRARAVPARVA